MLSILSQQKSLRKRSRLRRKRNNMLDDLIEYDGMQNIASELDFSKLDIDLNAIGQEIVRGYDADVVSRQGWMGEMKEAMDLALQVIETKTFPWENASNVKMPLITEAAIHYNSMMYPALIPPVDIVKARIVGGDPDGQKTGQAIRVSKHMSYQILEEMEEWEEEMDLGLMVQPILGNMYKKNYFDDNKSRNMGDMLTPREFVVDYNAKNIESCFRKTHVIPMTKNDIKKEILAGNYLDKEIAAPIQKDKQKEGESAPIQDESTNYDMLECHTYLDLDGDGLLEPYIVTVEHASEQVFRIVTGYDVNEIIMNSETVVDVPQLQYFTKYGFIPNPDGSVLDLGLGKLLGPTNKSVNTLINQLIDAGTKSIMGGGFLGRGIRVKGGNLRFKMGEYKRVDSPGQDLARNIVHLPSTEPSGVLFNLLGLLISHAQRLSSTMDSQVGEDPGQNQKATTSAIVQENGQKIFNGIYKRCHRSLKKELKKLYRLNSLNLPVESYLNVLDGDIPEGMEQVIRRSDYNVESVNIVPAADSQYTSQQQRMSKANALLQKIGTGLVNPKVAMQRALEAEEQPGIDQIMKVDPPQPSIEMLELQHKKQIDWANVEAKALELQQEEVRINAQAILALANAEAAEEGTQLAGYKIQLDELIAKSKSVGERANSLGKAATGSNGGMEGEATNPMGQSQP